MIGELKSIRLKILKTYEKLKTNDVLPDGIDIREIFYQYYSETKWQKKLLMVVIMYMNSFHMRWLQIYIP